MHQRPSGTASRPASPEELGLKAFHAGNYTEAIRLWNDLNPETTPSRSAALAEAHFRRALTARPPVADPITDLRCAIGFLPEEARYWYQLGLALHRADCVEEARQAYARAALEPISALLRGDPQDTLRLLARNSTPGTSSNIGPVDSLWRGLALVSYMCASP